MLSVSDGVAQQRLPQGYAGTYKGLACKRQGQRFAATVASALAAGNEPQLKQLCAPATDFTQAQC